ncbi:SDR family NAD(P)-dependent oxidoreductase, partial [Kitasatospora sp. NPDC057500]|uniref:SDR family NAD(P)-dependent oxidoreductase n=1 Tax=Kitasatospora sp. NPDC057500 TaxID=3346151 RepID=UPI00368598BC
VVAGDPHALDELLTHCENDGIRARRIAVDYASHTAHVENIRAELATLLADTTPSAAEMAFFSSVTGTATDPAELDAGYWYRNLRQTVRFEQATRELLEHGCTLLIEMSPHPVLVPAVRETIEAAGSDAVALGSLRRDEGGPARFVLSLAEAHVHGAAVDWAGLAGERATRRVDLPTYAFQHQRFWLRPPAFAGRSAEAVLDSWRYREEWRPVTAGGTARGRWLLVVPRSGAGAEAARALTGAEVVELVVEPGTGRRELAERLSESGEFNGVLAVLPDLWGSTVLVQALGDAGAGAPLWFATHGAVAPVDGDRVQPEASQLWGLGRVVALEHPDRWGGLVDLPERLDEDAAALLSGVLAGACGAEDQLAVRGTGLFGRRLVRAELRTPARPWSPRGTVLVTGGTGALGGHVARWAARNGAAHVVLTSRHGKDAPGADRLLAELDELGAAVTIAAGDVSDREFLARTLGEAGPLSAVFHTAGVSQYGDLAGLTEADFADASAGKVLGARHLDELLAGQELDAFVLFSSGAAVWGGAGQGAYAAANAYLDGLARQRRDRGETATSLSWGGWAGAGMLAGDAGRELSRRGIGAMAPDLALTALQQALDHDETLLTVADMDWARFAPAFTLSRRSPLIEEIPEVAARLREEQPDADPRTAALRQRLALADEAGRLEALTAVVRTEAAVVLGHGDGGSIDPRRPFRDLGFDSLLAVEFKKRLVRATGLSLPGAIVFDYPTPARLAHRLVVLLQGEADAAAPTVAAAGSDEPVAIVGMACRYPGGVNSPEDLWDLVASGTDAIGAFPPDRGWDSEGYGGFVHDAGGFDPLFFDISPREALTMDPQQRMVLETSWEALERAGIDPTGLVGSRTAVMVGASALDYAGLLSDSAHGAEGFGMTGNAGSIISGRVSYTLGLEGPALTIDTGCSSALVAIHTAAAALRGGEVDLALAGGVAVMATPVAFAEFERQNGLAGDGRVKAFADAADGTNWGEGVGLLLLERLSDAERNGHRVLAVIRGSAINQDGASNGLTAPNGPSQQRVIRQALANARLTTTDIDAVEAHGTGTTLGDP